MCFVVSALFERSSESYWHIVVSISDHAQIKLLKIINILECNVIGFTGY